MKKRISISKLTISVIAVAIMLCSALTAAAFSYFPNRPGYGNQIRIHFYNENHWSDPYIYCYDNYGEEAYWPGNRMYYEGNDWFSYTIYNAYEARVIFSNRGYEQNPGQFQPGFLVYNEMWYCCGNWYDHKPGNTIVHFYNENNWDQVNLYYYQNGAYNSYWPGVTMNYEKDNWYRYEIVGFENPNVIFSNRGNEQIPQGVQEIFSVSGEMWYKCGQWYTEEPDDSVEEKTLKVHFYNENWSNVYIYYYSSGQSSPSWPGKKRTNNGNGWFEYDIIGFDDPRILFNDNGNSIIHTDEMDLSEVNEIWYKDGSWLLTAPEGVVVYFYKPDSWKAPYIYYYLNDNDTGPAWPGVRMVDIGNGWYKYTITKYTNPRILFNDTINQIPAPMVSGYEVSGVVWFKNGQIYQFNPDTLGTNNVIGDLNGDGVIDSNDYNLLNNYLNGSQDLVDEQLRLADTNSDGIIDEKDTELLEKYINGEIDNFDVSDNLKDKSAGYVYDKLGRVTKVIYDENNYVEYTYDSNGNITNVNVVGNVEE